VREYAAGWLAGKKLEVSRNSLEIYSKGIKKLLGFLGAAADRDIAEIEPSQLAAFRVELASVHAAETVNMRLRVTKSLFSIGAS
jgi:hypothetical protein